MIIKRFHNIPPATYLNGSYYGFGRAIPVFMCMILTGFISCGKMKKSLEKEWINNPASGYTNEINGEGYTVISQYQTPEYRADQEIMLNKAKVNRKELIQEYNQLQQFLVKYKIDNPDTYIEELGLMERFNIITMDTIPCIDAHPLQYSPGAPYHEVLLLFPLTEKELGNQFTLQLNGFPFPSSMHHIRFNINKKD